MKPPKLTADQARKIFLSTAPARVVGRDYNVTGAAVSLIRHRKLHKEATKDLVRA